MKECGALRNVERLWQLNTLPYSEKVATRSEQELKTATIRVKVDGVQHYATPLLRCTPIINFQCTNEAVGPILISTECRLVRDFKGAESYCSEIHWNRQVM